LKRQEARQSSRYRRCLRRHGPSLAWPMVSGPMVSGPTAAGARSSAKTPPA